jgi:hypothetical protein
MRAWANPTSSPTMAPLPSPLASTAGTQSIFFSFRFILSCSVYFTLFFLFLYFLLLLTLCGLCRGFTLRTFAVLLGKKLGISPEKLQKRLWGDNFYDADSRKWCVEHTPPPS